MRLYDKYATELRKIAECKERMPHDLELRCEEVPSIEARAHNEIIEMLKVVLPAPAKVKENFGTSAWP